MSEEVLLDLSEPRVISIEDRGQTFQLTCRRVTSEDWTNYFNGIVVSSEQSGRDRINVVDVDSPRIALAEAVLTDASGYKVASGAELSSLENWRKLVPRAHRLKLGEILADCRPSQQAELVIHPEAEVVSLDCTWSHEGATMRFSGLKHFLKTPSEEQFRRYKREASRSVVVGGSRSGKTLYRGAQLLLAQLYDELVMAVEGYAVNGTAILSTETARGDMDLLHKVMAAQEIFQPQTPGLSGDEE